MDNLYNRIYNAVNEGIIKSLHIDDENNQIIYQHQKINNKFDPIQYEFIDLGLPSGTLWCDHNLGATCKNELQTWYGDYYAWGEIFTKNEYNWKTYRYSSDDGKTLYKYNTREKTGNIDNKCSLLKKDDVIKQKYSQINTHIKMPSKEQLEELIEYTTTKWVRHFNGISNLNGRIFTGSNGNSIFIPAAGHIFDSRCIGEKTACYIQSASIVYNDPLFSHTIEIDSDRAYISCVSRAKGLPIRAVYKK